MVRLLPGKANPMAHSGKRLQMAAIFVVIWCTAPVVWATDAPADPCSLLTSAAVSSTLGGTYGAPQKTIAPRPFANTVQGTDCHYTTASGRDDLLFRVYFDRSAAEATELHARLKMWFGAGGTPASVGDESYFDSSHAIHVRKGNVRFYLTASHQDSPAVQKQIATLATQVAGHL